GDMNRFVRETVEQVVADDSIKYLRLLWHVNDEIEPRKQPHVAQVVTINENCAGNRIHITHQQAHNRNLPRAGWANQRSLLAELNHEAHIAKNRWSRPEFSNYGR